MHHQILSTGLMHQKPYIAFNMNYTKITHQGVGEGDGGLPEIGRLPSPTPRKTILPSDAKIRKQFPIDTGCLSYFPNALLCVSHQSWLGNHQHHPDEPLHWDKAKSPDEADACLRHSLEGDLVAKAWRALAELERALENGYKPWPYIDALKS